MTKLPFPYSYYFSKYSEGKCPFCDSENLVSSDNDDIVKCTGYENGGYLSEVSCETYGHDGDGVCDTCGETNEYPLRGDIKGDVYLCEDCHHGVNFTKMELITDLFEHHDNQPCKHCDWHKEKSERQT